MADVSNHAYQELNTLRSTAQTQQSYAALLGIEFGPYQAFGKRVLDLVISLALLPIALVLIAPLALLVRRDGGAAFYGHSRIGRDGRSFTCWKLRSMHSESDRLLREHLAANPEAAEEWARDQKLTNDPRITRLGNFLRKSSLDELPQLLNVIKGDMSLVGRAPSLKPKCRNMAPKSKPIAPDVRV